MPFYGCRRTAPTSGGTPHRYMRMDPNPALGVKVLFLDVDGVMTDGRITLDEDGRETKSFHVKDGVGLKLLMAEGIDVVIVTGRASAAVDRRAAELGVRKVFQGVRDKGALCRRFRDGLGLIRREIACMGDDLPDLPMFHEAGLAFAVADAAEEVRRAAHYVTLRKGGDGAVREACEWLLKARGAWPPAVPGASGK